METTLYKIKTGDGRIFKVFCANKKQKDRFFKVRTNLPDGAVTEVLENGIHNIKQFETFIKLTYK
ncbi:MAG: hypothetical protein V4509_00510 [Patescibacteria group bacterium]